MKTKIFILSSILSFTLITGFSQEKSNKEIKEDQKIEKQKQIDSLVNSKTFVFIATRAFPQSGESIDLTTNSGFIKFDTLLIKCNMPFFGRAYSGIDYGGDVGMKFEGKPSDYSLTKTKNNYEIKANVKGTNDYYQLFLTINFNGSGSLAINCNNRSSISYFGDISKPEKLK
jgi:hypothetical protein